MPAIGAVAVLSQLGAAQNPAPATAGGPGWLTAKDAALAERFRELLIAVPTRDRPAGWQLASDIGRPAAPLLWELLRGEKADVANRMVLLAAAMLAGGPLEDEQLFAWLGQPKPMLEERTLAALLVALGPRRGRPMPDFWARFLGGAKTPQQLLAIAVRLAAVRFPGTADGAPVLIADDESDPGLAAATAFAGLTVPTSLAAKLWNLRGDPGRHADLFWRGALLGAARRARTEPLADGMLERARELMQQTGETMAPVRAAAAWLRAVEDDLKPEGLPLPLPLLRVAVGHLPTAQRLHPWLGAEPLPRDLEPARLAVAYALSSPPEKVIAQRELWGRERRTARPVAIALAWRLAGAGARVPAVDTTLEGVPEWSFVRAASGGSVERGATCEDPKLQAALALLANGRLERAPLRAQLEEALWRWASHPHLAPWELERTLVRDLLLAGSHPGGNKYQPGVPTERRYFPSGMDRGDEFFDIAVALYEFLQHPRAPVPPERRLPD